MEQKFFICEHCGNIVAMVKPSGVPIVCCGKIMKELIPGTTDASVEKHVPVYTVNDNRVEVVVGDVIHPWRKNTILNGFPCRPNKGIRENCYCRAWSQKQHS